MTTTHCRPEDMGGDIVIPCGSCRKRHTRSGGAKAAGAGGATSRPRLMALAVLAMAAAGMAPSTAHAADAASLQVAGVDIAQRGRPSGSHVFKAKALLRRLQEDGHDDHEHEHEHEEEGGHAEHLFVEEEHDEDHEEDHKAEEHQDHESHGLEEDHDEHMDHDEDHEGHDHGAEEEFSSFSEAANEDTESKNVWGQVIGATLLVNLATLSGCIIVAFVAVQKGMIKMRGQDPTDAARIGHGTFFDICIPAFAVGALTATAVFLIWPEALHLIEGGHGAEGNAHDDHSDEGEADDHSGHDHRYLQEDSHEGHDDNAESTNAAKFGCAVLGGFLLPFVFAIIFHHKDDKPEDISDDTAMPRDEDACQSCIGANDDVETGVAVTMKLVHSDSDNEVGETTSSTIIKKVDDQDAPQEQAGVPGGQESVPLVTKTVINRQLCASILLGDAFHNFADGVFIGAAFKSCSTGTAISIVFVTLFHEIAQEIADFIILTRYVGLSVKWAFVLNFLSGLSVCLGGIIFLAANPSDEVTGVILAMAGGVYFNIAGCETVPRLEGITKNRWDRVWTLFSIVVGTIPIGLILLNHRHCG